MAFLNDLDQKITRIGRSAVKKTKNITESVKLTGEISEEEARINQYYAEAGKLLFSQSDINALGEEYRQLYQMILASQNRIQELNRQKELSVNVKICPVCHARIPSDSIFCNSCGTNLSQAEARNGADSEPRNQNALICANCGAPLKEGQIFCINCGTKAAADAPRPAFSAMRDDKTEMVAEETVMDSEIQETSARCPSCGAEIGEGQVFCIHCGTKL